MSHPHQQSLQDIAEIRKMMDESSRFLSLSGLSGVSAGIVALIGAYYTQIFMIERELQTIFNGGLSIDEQRSYLLELVGIAMVILLCATAAASFFTIRRSRKHAAKLWTRPARRMLVQLLIPLVVGAIFCIQLTWYGFGIMVAPATLIFYGLAVMNAGKYTLREIRYLGLTELGLGLVAALYPGEGLVFWAIGFGVLHILYGAFMYFKYER